MLIRPTFVPDTSVPGRVIAELLIHLNDISLLAVFFWSQTKRDELRRFTRPIVIFFSSSFAERLRRRQAAGI